MNRKEALRILHLSNLATREQIEESYNQLREFYYPDYYGNPHEFTPQQIQENLYADLSGGHYKEPKGVQYKDFVRDTYHCAILKYARVCRAYDYLTDPANQNKYNVDPNSAYGHDVLRYGLVFANVRRVITWLVNWIAKPVLVAFLVSGLIKVMDNGHHEIFSVVTNIFKYLYVAIMGSAAITMPLDVLLFIPEGLWMGIWGGAQMGPWILRPITMLLTGALGAVIGAFTFFWKPRYMMEAREDKYDLLIKNQKKGRAAAEVWYRKTMDNIAAFHENCTIRISDDMPYIQSELKQLAEEYKRARRLVANAQASGDADVHRAEKNADMMGRFGWVDEQEEAIDDMLKARSERNEQVDMAMREFNVADRLFHAVAYRAGADPEDYIDE